MTRRAWIGLAAGALIALALIPRSGQSAAPASVMRVGHFPNVTHAQAVIGRKNGWFASHVTGVTIEWKHFNAGPSAMEALLAGALDVTYVGPSPAINVHVRSGGEAIRVIAGAANGGAALVVRKGAGIASVQDFKGKKVAAPEVGNTQDVALRHWLKANGLKPKAQGGEVDVVTVKNPDILSLFQQNQLDAAWVPEPWTTRLLREGNGELFLEEKTLWPGGQYPTVILVARTGFLKENRPVVEQFVRAHAELTAWIQANPDEAKRILNEGLAQWMGQPLPEPVLHEAFGRIEVTVSPAREAFVETAKHAWSLGYLPGSGEPDLSGLFDLIATEPATP